MKEVKLELTVEELQLIAGSLRELPYKVVVNLLQKIDRQVIPQLQEGQNDRTD
jgi:hypothetical protein